jgi:hypothetical protein
VVVQVQVHFRRLVVLVVLVVVATVVEQTLELRELQTQAAAAVVEMVAAALIRETLAVQE